MVPCDQLDTFQVELDTIVDGGVVRINDKPSFFPGKGATMGPTSARRFVELNGEKMSAVDAGSIVGINVRNRDKKVRITYNYIDNEMLKFMEENRVEYVNGKTEYSVGQ